MNDTNGKYVDEPRIFDPETQAAPANTWKWWFAAVLVFQSAVLLSLGYHGNVVDESTKAMRRELDENAKLIKQLQERIIVKDLANLRKGTP